MNNIGYAFDGAWRVLAAGLVLGAGLPLVFALGIRTMALGAGGDAELPDHGAARPPHPIGRLLALVCFAVVLAGVGIGITYIVASGMGKALSFEHIVPMLVDKK